MKREDAIKLFGSHYETSSYDNTINQVLGPANPEFEMTQFTTLEDAQYALARENVLAHQREVDRIAGIFNRFKLRIAVAKMRLHPNSAEILAQVDALNQKRQTFIDKINNPAIAAIVPLPDNIKIPHMLEIGQPLYVVRSTYTAERIALDEYSITERKLHRAYSSYHKEWDYVLQYRATNTDPKSGEQRGAIDFYHNRPDAENKQLDNNAYGHETFLTRDAAEQRIRAIAKEMIQKARMALRITRPPAP